MVNFIKGIERSFPKLLDLNNLLLIKLSMILL